jgi:hypothetical protein
MREICTRRSGNENALEIHPSARKPKVIGAFANRLQDDRGIGGLPFASDSPWNDGLRAFGGTVSLSGFAYEGRRLPALIQREPDELFFVCRDDKQAVARRQESCGSLKKLMGRRQTSIALSTSVPAHMRRGTIFPNVHAL